MQFIPLEQIDQINAIATDPNYQVILKHNTTCPISKGVLDRMQSAGAQIPGVETIHVLDLLAHRDLSQNIEERFGVKHQSPQILLLKNGECVYTEWGYDISAEATREALEG